MPKGQAPKVYGVLVNVPIDANKTWSLLLSDVNIIMVQLQKKISFKGHVYFEQVQLGKIAKHSLYGKHQFRGIGVLR